jgi:phosphatidylserine decarboxylase precursor-related protein
MQIWVLTGLLLALITTIPLAWRWQLGMLRASIVVIAFGAGSSIAVEAARRVFALPPSVCAAAVWLLTVGGASALLAFRFYRDPQRRAPDRDDVIVSPADGVVIYVRKSHEGTLPVSDKHGRRYQLIELTKTPLHNDAAIVIGIAMNFADVHVNRAPLEGRVTFRRHFPGRFGSLRKPEMVFENERATTVIEGHGLQVAVVQIASRLVRQIALFLREGEQVALGQRLGVIRLGSQVDVVLPAREDLRITTRIGERLTAGESIIAVFEPTATKSINEPMMIRADRQHGSSDSKGAIIIGEHCRGLGLVRSLGRRGIPVWTLEPEGELLASTSRYTHRSFPWPNGADAEQLDFLHSLSLRHGLEGWALFPTNDETTALFARHHTELAKRFLMTVPPWEVLAWAYDKRLTSQLAAAIGLDNPVTFYAQNRDELRRLDVRFPVILKPAFKREMNRFTRDKAWRADDRVALTQRYDEARELVGADVVMIQELIPGGGETQFSYGALCVDGRVVASVTARRTRQYPVEFGQSSSFVETVNEPAVEDAATRLLAAMRYTGLAEVEFKYDQRDGRYKLLEVNPRVWTWHALCGAAGVDFPYLLWRVLHGEAVPESRGRPGVRWARMSTDVAAACTEILSGHLSIADYVMSLKPPLQLSTFAFDDPAPALLRPALVTCSRVKRLFAATNLNLNNGAEHALATTDKH